MQNGERLNLEQIRAFLEAAYEVRFKAADRAEVYAWISRTLVRTGVLEAKQETKRLIRHYVHKVTGLSRSQVTRLVTKYIRDGT